MNKAGRIAAAINSQANPFQLRACLFHSTTVSERRRGTHWDSASFAKGDQKTFNRRQRRLRKKSLLRNVDEFAENLFQSWKPNRGKPEPPPHQRKSWFQPDFEDDGPSRARSRNRTSRFRTRFDFCDVDDEGGDFDNIFRSMFGGNRQSFYWSFTRDDDEQRYWSSSTYSSNFRTSSGRRYHFDEEFEQEFNTSREYERPAVGSRSDRLALGLSPSGPLKMDDVKTAYRACALKWHPDRHQGSSKVVAEEKFKVCSAAYQSLCDKLAIN